MENNLESYLVAIEAQLNDIPAARKTEFMDEVRAHMHAMWEAKRADGLDAATAWLSAMEEFGNPENVGRQLRRQWADSAQLESEGVPLSLRRKWWIFALPVVASVVVYAFATMAISPQNNQGWQIPFLTLMMFGSLGYGIASDVRKRGGWKPSLVVGCVQAVFICSQTTINIYGGFQPESQLVMWGGFAIQFVLISLYLWFYKSERADRPWQFSSLYKTNPIAAEQQYRLSPIVGLVLGNVLGCIGMISVGLQFFGLPIALLSCAMLISGSVILGKWLFK